MNLHILSVLEKKKAGNRGKIKNYIKMVYYAQMYMCSEYAKVGWGAWKDAGAGRSV